MPIVDEKMVNGLAVFASGYTKRWMEGNYDKFMETDVGKKLKSMSPTSKYALEAALYALMAYADQNIQENTPISKFLREVAMDAPPEIAKRFINGVKNQLKTDAEKLSNPEQKLAAQSLLQLNDKDLSELLRWLSETPRQDLREVTTFLDSLSKDELQRFCNLSPDQKKLFLEVTQVLQR
jgi:hypothetical protein